MRLAIEDIAGMSLTLTGVLIEHYIKEGYADPTMYQALKAATELAENFAKILKDEGNEELSESVMNDLVVALQITTMEAGEVIGRIIDEHNLPVNKRTFEVEDN